MAGGKRNGLAQRPEALGEETGWWFAWQAYPILLADGHAVMRKSVYTRPTGPTARFKKMKDKHRKKYGDLCMGAPEIQHESHYLKPGQGEFLTVDHIIPIFLGGNHEPDNLRIVCNWANARLARNAYRRSKKRKKK